MLLRSIVIPAHAGIQVWWAPNEPGYPLFAGMTEEMYSTTSWSERHLRRLFLKEEREEHELSKYLQLLRDLRVLLGNHHNTMSM